MATPCSVKAIGTYLDPPQLEVTNCDLKGERRKKIPALWKIESDRAERDADYEKAAKLRYGEISTLQKELEKENHKLAEIQKDRKMLKEEVDEEDIAEVVSKWTGIPISKLTQTETEKLLHLEDELHKRVVGQGQAVSSVAQVVRSARAKSPSPIRWVCFVTTRRRCVTSAPLRWAR